MEQQLTNKNTHCLNCKTVLNGNFCAECGQSGNTAKITFKETISNFFTIAFALEGPLWLTIRLLIVNPGKLFREYISGKRKTYYKPIAFFILLTATYLILRALIHFDPLVQKSIKYDLEDVSAFSTKFIEVIRLMSVNINNILFLLVFSISIVFKLFFGKRYNLAEYTSISLYIVGLYTLVKILTMFLSKYAEIDVDNMELGILLLIVFYSSFSLFKENSFYSFIKYILIGILSLSLYILFALGFFLLVVYLKQ